MREFEAKFGHWVIQYRWLIILATLLAVMAAASGGRFIEFKTSYRIFFSEDNPQLLAFEALENTYTKNDNVMFVLAPKSGQVFTPDTLSAVETLTERAWQIPYSIRVDSLSNFQHISAEEDDLIVQDLYSEASSLSAGDLTKIKEIALAEPLLAQRLVSPEAHVTAVNVTIQLPGINEATETPELVAFARGLREEILTQHPEMEIYMTGMSMMNNAFPEASIGDMTTLVPLSFGIMFLFLAILLRNITVTLVTLVVLLFSILTAMGGGGHIGFPLTPPSASAPTIILTVAIANAVHILVSFLHSMRHRMERNEALVESLRINLEPVFLASLTTALGFLSMNFSEVPPFQHLGNFVAMGVVASFILSVTFLPAVISLLPIRIRHYQAGEDLLFARLGDFIVRYRTKLLYSMAVIITILVASVPRNELNDVFVNYFDRSIQFRVDSDFTTDNLTGLYVIEYSLEAGEPGGISEPSFLSDVSGFVDWYRTQPETMHVNTVTDTFKRLNRNMHGDNDDYHRLPERRDLAAQYLLLYEMSLPYGLDLNNQINVDKSATRVSVSLKTLSSNEVIGLEKRAQAWLSANTSHIKRHEGSGTTLMFANIGKRNIMSMLVGTTVALLLISTLLIVALRSVKIGLISMVPNLVPAAMGFGLWGIFVGEVGLALSVVTGMTLGIVVDDTVHFLSKYLRARREKAATSPDAVRYAFTTVGRALTITTIVLMAGFFVLSFSHFELNAGMGLLTTIVIAFALIADFLFLPPLLMKLEEKADEKARIANASVDTISA